MFVEYAMFFFVTFIELKSRIMFQKQLFRTMSIG